MQDIRPDFNLDAESTSLMELSRTNRTSRYNRKKLNLLITVKDYYFYTVLILLVISILHYILLAHREEDKMDFTNADLIFFLTLPLFCLFP